MPAFENAISVTLPDEKFIESLKKQEKKAEKDLQRIRKELKKLVVLALSGTLEKSMIREKEQELLTAQTELADEPDEVRSKLSDLPDIEQIKQEAEAIRKKLLLEIFRGKSAVRNEL